MSALRVRWLGRVPYREALAVQQALFDHGREQHLLLLEHDHVFTYGRHADLATNLRCEPAAVGADFVGVKRGGDITYHGPGQLVAYGIIDLKAWDLGIIDYVSGLEEIVMGVLADWGLRGERNEAGRGVWVDGRKIASIGLNVRRWITMHGIALNIDPDMSHWELINACGMPDAEITSMATEVGRQVAFQEVLEAFVFHFGRVFEARPQMVAVPGRDAGRA